MRGAGMQRSGKKWNAAEASKPRGELNRFGNAGLIWVLFFADPRAGLLRGDVVGRNRPSAGVVAREISPKTSNESARRSGSGAAF